MIKILKLVEEGKFFLKERFLIKCEGWAFDKKLPVLLGFSKFWRFTTGVAREMLTLGIDWYGTLLYLRFYIYFHCFTKSKTEQIFISNIKVDMKWNFLFSCLKVHEKHEWTPLTVSWYFVWFKRYQRLKTWNLQCKIGSHSNNQKLWCRQPTDVDNRLRGYCSARWTSLIHILSPKKNIGIDNYTWQLNTFCRKDFTKLCF